MLLLAALSLPLAGCETAASKLDPRIIVVCGTVANYARDDMAKAAGELAALPPDSAIGNVLIPDLGRMRDEARACLKPPTPP